MWAATRLSALQLIPATQPLQLQKSHGSQADLVSEMCNNG